MEKLTQNEFESRARAAKTFARLGDDDGSANEFWNGYARGLRRNYHGENFGTDEEHTLWMGLSASDDWSRKLRGIGYQAGFDSLPIADAMKIFESQK